MDDEIKEYLDSTSKLLNGQMRGSINMKAREVNLEFITMTIHDIWSKAYELGGKNKEEEINLERFKNELRKDGTGEENT